MSANRLLVLRTTSNKVTTKESWRFDSWNFSDSEALHRVLCIRDPGKRFQVSFSEPKNGFPADSVRLG